MNASVSLVLTVHNAQDRLAAQAELMLDELSQLSTTFELIVVDDGSTDDTYSVATELATRFPQVRVLRQPLRYGQQAAEARGIESAQGDYVMVCAHAESAGLHKLWRSRNDPTLVMVVNPAEADRGATGSPHHRLDPQESLQYPSPVASVQGIRLIRKDAYAQLGKPRGGLTVEPIVVGI